MKNDKVRIAIVGLGFGAEFIPIYQRHPHSFLQAVCQRNREKLEAVGNAFEIPHRYTDYKELLNDPEIDAVHINSPIPDHAAMSIAALEAGKHVACTVPMATSLEDCGRIVAAQIASGKKYMMMETVVYSREFLYVKSLNDKGLLGRIQFLRGAHHQQMAGWPGYWEGLPPMHYATHAVSPLLAIAGSPAEAVACVGSGSISKELSSKHGSPFAVESALIRLKESALSAEITRSLFETAREYVESFDIYGEHMSFEWTQVEGGQPVLFTGEKAERVEIPDFAHLLPENIRPFTTKGVYDSSANKHLSFVQGSGHGGSHPHLAHQFIMSILEDKDPFPDVFTSANWTCVGLCAHQSAMNKGKWIELPGFTFGKS
ncbi:MAG: Gfo/Idh/MocA family oxidoreductase [Fibrobacterota bacterium]|nr:Gfo/Idh/MocA family oxidoreductase [Fibrobacterota bacterium]